jgi:hypothetical protein
MLRGEGWSKWSARASICPCSIVDILASDLRDIARSGLVVALTRKASPSVHAPTTAGGHRRPTGMVPFAALLRVARLCFFSLTYRIRCLGAKFVSSGLYVESARPRWPVESSLSRFAGPGFVPCAAAFNLHPHGVVSRRLRRPMGHKWRAYRCCSIRDLSRSSATASLRSICSTTHARCLHSIGGRTSHFCHEQSRTRSARG